jgi:transglutaminase/protease-like cytokinesis protein 3
VHYDHKSVQQKNWDESYIHPTSVFQRKSAICAGFANLFKKFLTVMGIECYYVPGFVKTSVYRPDAVFDKYGDPKNISPHAWNCFLIDGNWYLCDCSLASGYIRNNTYHKQINLSYFAVLPQHFIFTHYPQDLKWQLNLSDAHYKYFEWFYKGCSFLPNNDRMLLYEKYGLVLKGFSPKKFLPKSQSSK